MYNNVKNSARLVGEVVSKYSTDKVTILTIKTEKKDGDKVRISFPKAICFEKVKPQTDKIEIGDYVLADCTIQANQKDESIKNQSMRTVAVNHITKVNPSDERYRSINSFRFFCRVLKTTKLSDHVAIARIFFFTNRAHYMTVVFKNSDPERVESFCNIQPNEFVILNGAIETRKFTNKDGTTGYAEDCVARVFKKTQRKTKAASEKTTETTSEE